MNTQNPVFLEKQDGIATIFLNRPEKRNALNLEMWKTIADLLQELEDDPDVNVLILRGINETAFAAGADISEFEHIRSNAENAQYYNRQVEKVEMSLLHCKIPTIAMIHGFCIGGGCELALACDLRFSADNGVFGITASKLGIVYGVTGTRNLVHAVGPSKAKDILFSGRLLDSQEALQIGLVDRIYPINELEKQTYDYARLIAERAPKSVRGSKQIIHEILQGTENNSKVIEELALEAILSEDYREGVRAFLEKRKPIFTGK